MQGQGITNVTIHHENMNAYTKFHGNSFNSCHILRTKKVNHMVALEGMLGDNQTQ